MNVAHINLSHGNRASHQHLIDMVKKAREKAVTYTAILLDTGGPELRVQEMAKDIKICGVSLTSVKSPSSPNSK